MGRLPILLGVLSLFVANVAYTAGRLSVELRYPTNQTSQRSDAGNGEIEMVLKNEGNRAIDIPVKGLSLANTRGQLLEDLLDVVSSDGLSVPYQGMLIELSADAEPNYLHIAPHAVRTIKVNIPLNYAVRSGDAYTISLRKEGISYLSKPRSEYTLAKHEDLSSLFSSAKERTPLRIWIAPGFGLERSRISDVAAATPCESTQVSSFNSAKALATTMSMEAAEHVSGLYHWDDAGHATFTQSARYTKWFGIHGDPNVQNEDDNFVDAMIFISHIRISDDQSNPKPIMTVTCQCTTEDGIDPTKAVAWVTRSVHYVVNACPKFWAAPTVPSVKDENSKVGTLVHEATHFVDDWYGGTADAPEGQESYDATAAMVISDRSKAVRNANNYKLFVLNQTW